MSIELYRRFVGLRRDQLETPAMILDLDIARANIDAMAERLRGRPAKLRPHIKVHKSPEVARLQVQAGAIGVCTATVWEAIAMIDGGIDDVLIANSVAGSGKLRALADAAQSARLAVAVDDVGNLDAISAQATVAGSVIGVLVDIDVGMARCGVRSPEEGLRVARHALTLPGIEFRGVMGYEGHCMLEPDRELRVQKQVQAMADVMEVVDVLVDDGIECDIVSCGGTGTYDLTSAHPRVTELQAGSYVFMDAFHRALIPGFPVALTVLATVISRHGTRVILDAGLKSVGSELRLPEVVGHQATTVFTAEEHLGVDVPEDSSLRVGDTVELLTGYGPTTVNHYGAYHVVEGGIVTDIWPVRARYGTDDAIEKRLAGHS